MALPIILVNSTGGSDTQASGAGPATALFGAAGVTSGTGLTVTLDGSPDLSGVATDGSHVLFMSDTAAGARNFSKITAVDNGTKVVTVANAFGLSNTDAWAIGGKRASVGSTTSKKLLDNNAGNGDAMPGWIVEMESGHTETIAATLQLMRSGDITDGVITLRGALAAGTRPIITFTNNGLGFSLVGSYLTVEAFELRNTNATKTASTGITGSNGATHTIRNITINHATNKFWKGIRPLARATISLCEVANTASFGIDLANTSNYCHVLLNWVYSCGGAGINVSNNAFALVSENLIHGNSIGIAYATGTASGGANCHFIGNVINASTGDGMAIAGASTQGAKSTIRNNIFSNNGGYGINWSDGSASLAFVEAQSYLIAGNNFYLNTSGKYNPSGITSLDETTTDPTFTNAASGDFSIGTNLKAKGYPLGGTLTIGRSSTYSYIDPGAAQREEAGAGGGGRPELRGSNL